MTAGIRLNGFEIHRALFSGARTEIFCSTRLSDAQPVILKRLATQSPSNKELARFRREYELAAEIDDRHILQVLDLIHIGGHWTIVASDIGGRSLDQIITGGDAKAFDFLPLATFIAEALAVVHDHAIIHKDICPANIIVSEDLSLVQIIDFGIAAKLSHEESFSTNLKHIEGTFAYISPEQTGRMNRPIDQRSDLYSLGITFFQMLTGTLPFPTDDPLELIHCHIAKEAPDVTDLKPQVPLFVARIIKKLLAKEPDHRYQTAQGLIHDLRLCASQDEPSAPLGINDVSSSLVLPTRLYGRDNELVELHQAFERSLNGSVEIVLVKGASGIGKSAVVGELGKSIAGRRGLFTKGKFDQYIRNSPYLGFIQAFRSLVSGIFSMDADKLKQWRERIATALGDSGRVLVEVIPELHLLLDALPEVPSLPPLEASNRLRILFESFVHSIAAPEHPLVVFLDDLQWADGGSLKLLEILASHSGQRPIMVILAYRDHEVDAMHPFQITLNLLRDRGARFTNIDLHPLALADVTAFVTDALHIGSEAAGPLAQLVVKKTGGNPFFLTKMLRMLYQSGAIRFDAQRGQFGYELEEVLKVPIADNVVNFVLGDLRLLPEDCGRALAHAALIGAEFALDALANVLECRALDLGKILEEAIRRDVIVPLEAEYRLLATADTDIVVHFRFGHDRIQQAALGLLDDAEIVAAHCRIGHYFDRVDDPRAVLDAASHLHAALSILSSHERARLAELCFRAGNEASKTAAYQPAFQYFEMGLQALGAFPWDSAPELTLSFHVRMVEIAYNADRIDKLEGYFDAIEQRSFSDPLLVMPAYIAMAGALRQLARYDDALRVSCAGLLLMGEPISQHPSTLQVAIEALPLQIKLSARRIPRLLTSPELKDRRHMATMDLYAEIASAAFFVDQNLLAISVMRRTKHVLKFGMSESGANGIAAYGAVLAGILKRYDTAHQLETVLLQTARDRGYGLGYLRTAIIAYGLVNSWKESRREDTLSLERIGGACLASGDLEWGSNALFLSILNRIYCWDNLQHLVQTATAWYGLLQHYHQEHMKINMHICCQIVGHLAKAPITISPDLLDEEGMSKMLVSQPDGVKFLYYNGLSVVYFFLERYEESVIMDTKALPFLWSAECTGLPFPQSRAWAALALLASMDRHNFNRKALRRIRPKLSYYKALAKVNPRSIAWVHHLFCAELARLKGHDALAMVEYQQARRHAAESGFLAAQAVAAERSGRFYLSMGDHSGMHHLRDAHHFYSDWGAGSKIQLLEAAFPELNAIHALTRKSSVHASSTTSENLTDELDLESICRACQAISRELRIEDLIRALARITLESAGARRGLIFVRDGKTLRCHIDASLHADFSADMTERELDSLGAAVPSSVINYVWQSQNPLAIDDASNDLSFAHDPYIVKMQSRSIACLPIESQGEMLGLLYLENDLISAAFTSGRMKTLNLLATQGAISIRNVQHVHDVRAKVRLEDQMRAAQAVQVALLPSQQDIPGVSISYEYLSANETGGDWFGYHYDAARQRLYIQIGDVTGHGIPSALVTGVVCGAIASAHALLPALKGESAETCLEMLVRATNQAVAESGQKSNLWMTMGFVMIDLCSGEGLYHNAGHLPILVKNSDEVKILHVSGNPLGVISEVSFIRFQFNPGDLLLMITDGLIENNHGVPARKRFRQLKKFMRQARDDSELKASIIKAYDEYMKGITPDDDATFLAIKRSA